MEESANPTIVNSPALENWQERLEGILAKGPEELNDEEIHILIGRVGYLNDEERVKFGPVLIRSNLTPEELYRYTHLKLLDSYFPQGE